MAAIVRDVMREYDVDPGNIEHKYKLQSVRGYGHSRCPGKTCKHSWSSHHGWITIDFRQQRICKFWKQKCKTCGKPERMFFQLEELVKMIEIALIRCVFTFYVVDETSYNIKEWKKYIFAPSIGGCFAFF